MILPDNKRVKKIYAYLCLKALERGRAVISIRDVKDAIAISGIDPHKYTVKKYLIILSNNVPQLISFKEAFLMDTYYNLFFYRSDEKGEIHQIPLQEVQRYKADLVLVLAEEDSENLIEYSKVLRQKLQEESIKQGEENVLQNGNL